ncbi:MAG: ribonuclease H-like domain-containing protein [Planctomycetota bacterium]
MKEDLASRLARLRRETGDAPARDAGSERVAPPPARELPAHLVSNLARRARPDAFAALRTRGVPARLVELGGAWLREERFERAHRHGEVRLASALGADPASLAFVASDPRLAALDPARALFLDIEATGLSGGSGTYPFLVALGSFEDGAFVVRQHFMASPDEERALLESVAASIREAGAMVTFFGKSYDRHRLEDKMRHHRVAPPFDDVLHLDLFHPLKRLYGGSRPDDRLATNESELVGVARENDLPGAFAPAAWFDFVAGRAHLLEEVFRHNLEDVLSLATLLAHLSCAAAESELDGAELRGSARHRAAALARLHERARDHAQAAHWYDAAAERSTACGDVGADEFARLRLARARAHERCGRPAWARAEYEALARHASDPEVAVRAADRATLLATRGGSTKADASDYEPLLGRVAERALGAEARAALRRLRARLGDEGPAEA